MSAEGERGDRGAVSSPGTARATGSVPVGMDDYSEVLGMTPREHERRMRKWYVLLAIVGFFGVFGEGILMMLSKSRSAREAGAVPGALAPPPPPSTPAAGAPRDTTAAEPRAGSR